MKLLLRLLLISSLITSTAWAGTLDSDDFNRADTGGTQVEQLGAKWLINSAGKYFKILTNTARVIDTANDSAERNVTVTWPNDQCSQFTLTTVSASGAGTGGGPGVRWDTGGANTGYRVVGATAGFELVRYNAGTPTVLLNSGGTTFANGDTLKLCAIGQTTVALKMYKNNVEFSAGTTDATGSRLLSGSPAICFSSTATAVLDDFIGSSVASPQMPIVF